VYRLTGRLTATSLVVVGLVALVGTTPLLDGKASGQKLGPVSRTVLALGDSVPAGTACGCSPFPNSYGSMLSQRTGRPVTVDNEAVGGLDTSGLLVQLQQPGIEAAVRGADVVLLTIGANDFADEHDTVVEGSCTSATSDCSGDELLTMSANLARALAEIRTLRAGRPTSVLVTGYWNVFEDGQVGKEAAGDAGLRASIQLTRRVNDAIRAVSGRAGASYVDLFAPFQQYGADIDELLAPDGDHPNAAGHRLIATALLDAGLPRLS
jgi:lysophospholipase L1-like esterase